MWWNEPLVLVINLKNKTVTLRLLMCGGSKSNLYPFDMATEDRTHKCCSKLLEFAATDDLTSFIQQVEERGSDVNQPNLWYGRSFGTKKMGFEERTPIMIASLYGSTQVLNYLIHSCKVDVNKPCGSDGAIALHCAAAGGAWSCVEVVELLIGAGADVNAVDANGKKAGDLIPPCIKSSKMTLEMTLNGAVAVAEEEEKKKDYPSLPDINVGVYGSDEFRMYSFKVKPCSRAYSHDWTECPFAHPGENARRRDPIKYNYSCVPCPDFKKGSCGKGDACEYAHGVFESWLHPAQYRTRLCKDEIGCSRKVCFFAHKPDELRPLYASTGSAMPSPTPTPTTTSSSPMWQQKLNLTPPALQLSATRLKTSDFNPTNLEELLGSLDPSMLSHLQGMQNSPTGVQIRKNVNHLRASYPSNASSSPVRKPAAYGLESPLGVRGSPLCNRSQSFIDRGGVSYGSPNRASLMLSDWGSPDGKLDWGFSGEDASKLRKSASFGIRGGSNLRGSMEEVMPPPPPPHWMDQLYIDQEQMVA